MGKPYITYICGGLLLLSAVSLILVTSAWCAEPNWLILDENKDSRFYFDQNGAQQPNKGTIEVRTRVVYSDEGKDDALKILQDAKKFKGLFESRYRHALDCKKEQSRLLEVSHLDQEGVTIKSSDLASATEWEDIPADARMGLVLEKVCSPPAGKK
jgi:hypothetical protein